MLIFDVFAWTMGILGFFLSLQGLWLVCRALWPERVQAAAGRCRRNGFKCLLLGLPITAAVIVVAAVMGQGLGAPGQLAGWLVLGAFLMYAGVGMAGLVTHIGQRLPSPADADKPWRATVRGGVVLEMAFLIPFVGWFGLTVLAVVMGAGATTLSFFKQKPEHAQFGGSFGGRLGERVGAEEAYANRTPPPVPAPSPDYSGAANS
jgi:hypothetical protein